MCNEYKLPDNIETPIISIFIRCHGLQQLTTHLLSSEQFDSSENKFVECDTVQRIRVTFKRHLHEV